MKELTDIYESALKLSELYALSFRETVDHLLQLKMARAAATTEKSAAKLIADAIRSIKT